MYFQLYDMPDDFSSYTEKEKGLQRNQKTSEPNLFS